jgi:hypothetical protein
VREWKGENSSAVKDKGESKARINKLILANQLLLKDNYVSNVIKQKLLCEYLKKMLKCVNFRLVEFIYRNFGW